MKILAVDDDTLILDLLTTVLSNTGHKGVEVSSSAPKALQMVQRSDTPFDCLLLDIQMPDMDGIELCRAIRTVPGYEETPIIMLTAMTERSYIEEAFLAGATDYITKPFDVLEISARIRVAAKLSEAHSALEARVLGQAGPGHGADPDAPHLSRDEMATLFADDLMQTKPLQRHRKRVA